jgi:hypothetical protein
VGAMRPQPVRVTRREGTGRGAAGRGGTGVLGMDAYY